MGKEMLRIIEFLYLINKVKFHHENWLLKSTLSLLRTHVKAHLIVNQVT